MTLVIDSSLFVQRLNFILLFKIFFVLLIELNFYQINFV